MSENYNHQNYEASVLPSWATREDKDMVALAIESGWTMRIPAKDKLFLFSPDEVKTFTLSQKQKSRNFAAMKRTIVRHADPAVVARLSAKNAAVAPPVIRHITPPPPGLLRVAEKHDKAYDALVDNFATERRIKEQEAAASVALDGDTQVVDGPSRHVVSEEPMLAKRGGQRGYPSTSTNERVWSDGSKDYTCRFDGCDYVSEFRGGPSGHWRTHVNAGEAEPIMSIPKTIVDYTYEPGTRGAYTPRAHRVGALARVLAALDLTAMSAEELAEFVLNWQHQQSESGGAMAAEREEMTSDQVLDRIRAMLDNGLYLRQQDEIAALRAEAAALDQRATEAENEAQRVKGDLSGMLELLADYRSDPVGEAK